MKQLEVIKQRLPRRIDVRISLKMFTPSELERIPKP